jgi:hypothetical protein
MRMNHYNRNIDDNVKKTYIIDTFSFDEHHCLFNSAMISSIYLAFHTIDYFASKSSFKNIKKNINNHYDLSSMTFHSCFVLRCAKGIGLYLRYIFSAFQNIRMILFIPRGHKVFFLSTSYLFMKTIQKISNMRDIRCFFICHGELECFNQACSNKRGGKILGKIIKNIFLNSNEMYEDNVSFIVLGENIKRNLNEVIPDRFKKRIISIDHPVIFLNNIYSKSNVNNRNDKIIVSIISNVNRYRGEILLDIVKKINSKIKINLQIVSRILDKDIISKFIDVNITLASISGDTIARKDYVKKICESNFILFLYPVSDYKFTASGAIFDAISNYKPILALRNDYFNYIFSLVGHFGILADNIDEIVDFINTLTPRNIELELFDKLRAYFSPENISRQLIERCI